MAAAATLPPAAQTCSQSILIRTGVIGFMCDSDYANMEGAGLTIIAAASH